MNPFKAQRSHLLHWNLLLISFSMTKVFSIILFMQSLLIYKRGPSKLKSLTSCTRWLLHGRSQLAPIEIKSGETEYSKFTKTLLRFSRSWQPSVLWWGLDNNQTNLAVEVECFENFPSALRFSCDSVCSRQPRIGRVKFGLRWGLKSAAQNCEKVSKSIPGTHEK